MGAPLHCYTCAGGGQILENWGKVKPKWRCGVMVEAVNHHWLHPTSILDVYKVIEHLHVLWIGMDAPLYCYSCAGGGQILENWGKVKSKWRCDVMVEAVNNYWLHSTSILDVYTVFEHLHMLWMGKWVHPYTVIPVQVGAKFWKIGVRWSPQHWDKQKRKTIHFYSYIYFFCRGCCQNLGIFAIMGNSMTWTSSAMA